jgi:hypothetical protein
MRKNPPSNWFRFSLFKALFIIALALPSMWTLGFNAWGAVHFLLMDEPFVGLDRGHATAPGQAERSRHVTLNPLVTHPDFVFEGDRLWLNFFEDALFPAEVDSVTTNRMGTVTIRVRIDEKEFSHALIITDNGQSIVLADIPEMGRQYRISYESLEAKYQLFETPMQDLDYLEPIAVEIPTGLQDLDSSGYHGSSMVSSDPSPPEFDEPDLMSIQQGIDDPATISVMIVYTPAARQWAVNSGGINNVIAAAMARAQLVADNSSTGVTFELVHSAEVDYLESGSAVTDLSRLRGASDGYMDEIHYWRDLYGADLVSLFAYVNDVGGAGYLLNTPFGRPDSGFSITRVQQAAGTYTHVHEMGHNMGLDHHKQQLESPGPGLFTYSAGWRWVSNDQSRYCSVMTYENGVYFSDGLSHTRVPYFSHPNFSHLGAATGHVLDGDNARTFRELKHIVAAYRVSEFAVTLAGGQVITNLSGAQGSTRDYKIAVPPGQSSLTIKIWGGSGDCDLYVKFGSRPTTSIWDYRPYLVGNNETVTVNYPASGDWYIMLRGYTAYSGVYLSASY